MVEQWRLNMDHDVSLWKHFTIENFQPYYKFWMPSLSFTLKNKSGFNIAFNIHFLKLLLLFIQTLNQWNEIVSSNYVVSCLKTETYYW